MIPWEALDPGGDEARSLLRRELLRAEYNDRPLLERITDFFADLWQRLVGSAAGAGTSSTLAVVLIVLGLLAVLLATLPRVRAERRLRGPAAALLADGTVGADALRRRAEAAHAAGDHAAAVADAVRALARRAVERDLVGDLPGRTAHEVLALVAERFPEHAEQIRGAADTFDAAVYGDRPVPAQTAADALALEDAVRRSRPVTGSDRTAAGAAPAVPR